MSDFQFLEDSVNTNWTVLAPRRAKRPDEAKGTAKVCPFCPGNDKLEEEVYRIPEDPSKPWALRVLKNKFPFAPIHEVIVHSPDHTKNFDTLPAYQVKQIVETYKHRYNEHARHGHVCIFHNRGERGGESLPHPHSQLAVVPFSVAIDTPMIPDMGASDVFSTEQFFLACPQTSQWPDEVWMIPQNRKKTFGEITDEEILDMSHVLSRLIQILDLRHGQDFPFNFYIYPEHDWYLRLIPRLKTLGGFELATNIYVNTQDPRETLAFITEHFNKPGIQDGESIDKVDYITHI